MHNVLVLKKKRAELSAAIEGIVLEAGRENRALTDRDQKDLVILRTEASELDDRITALENSPNRSLVRQFRERGPSLFMGASENSDAPIRRGQKPMSAEYNNAFLAFLRSGGKQATDTLTEGFDPLFGGYALPSLPGMSAAAYEGGSTTGAAAVSVPTDPQIANLAVPDLGVRQVARVIPTATDIKLPRQTAFSTAAIKSESGGSSNAFTSSDPTLANFTLSAFMLGLQHICSWELLSDVQLFQTFSVTDLLRAIDILEDGYFVSGTGTGQPEGLIGNVGTGTGSATAVESTGAYLLQATFDVLATLKAQYFPTSSWLMNRATGAAIRKAQMQSNLFAQIWTRENGRDMLHGYPVVYSSSVPDLPTSTSSGVTPVLFGSFADAYVIGDRGGSGTFVKILDQPLAQYGQTVLLGYKRVDGRVRLAEAVQQISISHS